MCVRVCVCVCVSVCVNVCVFGGVCVKDDVNGPSAELTNRNVTDQRKHRSRISTQIYTHVYKHLYSCLRVSILIVEKSTWHRINALVPRVQKIKIRQLALTGFYWFNL